MLSAQKAKVPITYQAAPLENAGDVVDASLGSVAGRRGLYPRGSSFRIPWTLSEWATTLSAVREIVRVYEEQKLPDIFKVERDGVMLHVIPSGVRNEDGLASSTASELDALISFPEEERSGLEASVKQWGIAVYEVFVRP